MWLLLLLGSYAAMAAAQAYGAELIGLLWGPEAQAHAESLDTSSVQAELVSYEDLCDGYAAAHYHPFSNCLHAAGMLAMGVLAVCGMMPPYRKALLWLLPVYYLPAWVGHFGFQKDIPAVFTYGTTWKGWYRGEFCAWEELLSGYLVGGPFELTVTSVISNVLVFLVLLLVSDPRPNAVESGTDKGRDEGKEEVSSGVENKKQD